MPSASDIGMIVALGVGIVIVIELAKAGFRTTTRGRTITT
jgi:hypothetical protein